MIYLGSDHAGFELKEQIKEYLDDRSIEYQDLGANSTEPIDYPAIAKSVAQKVAGDANNRGILFCRSGQGMAIAANRTHEIRAALAWTPEVAAESRRDNNSNILSLPAGYVTTDDAVNIIQTWLDTKFSGAERHIRRIAQIDQQ